jgi:hypothetical protein
VCAVQDHFRRLKFNYLEQEAKRNFLFSITGDEPQGVQPGENEALGATVSTLSGNRGVVRDDRMTVAIRSTNTDTS